MKRGRPKSIVLSEADQRELAKLYLQTNRTATGGSATMAARTLAATHTGLAEVLERRQSKHDLPTAVWQAVEPAKRLVKLHREGEKGLRQSGYVPGRLRLAPDGSRRLIGGEQVSGDDGTINFGVSVPWPWGGCKCSDKFGVRLGRFQLLPMHDDASSYIPAWTYIIRPEQSYRGNDVSGLLLRYCRDVCLPDRFVLEGGVWQGARATAAREALGVELIDVRGRPQDKLIENFFNRFWTRLSIETGGQVGRFREDDKEGQKLYVECQAGRKDPRRYFPLLADALAAIERAVTWENNERIESKTYGKWVPVERWARDLEENPRPKATGDHLWLAAPVMVERVVRRGMIQVTADGPWGMRAVYHFTSPELWEHDRKSVRVAFDPLVSPAVATIADPAKPLVLCTATSVDPWSVSTGMAVGQVQALRSLMRREYRVLLPDRHTGAQRIAVSETEIRGTDRAIEIRSGAAAVAEAEIAELTPRNPQPTTPNRDTGADLSRSLRRRAAEAALQSSDAAW